MRINEITDAQGQLELLRTIIDNTWGAIAKQAEQERRAEAERTAKAKFKPRASKPIKLPYVPKPPSPSKPKPSQLKKPTPIAKPTNPNAIQAIKAQPTSHPKFNPQLNLIPNDNPNAFSAPAQNTPTAPKDGFIGKNMGAKNNDAYGDDRHSKNGMRSQKKPLRNF